MFTIEFTTIAQKLIKKYIKPDKILAKSFIKTLEFLREDPFYSGLNTHKVSTIRSYNVWSSRINGDWRLIWTFDTVTNQPKIICLEVGTHSGAAQVYTKKSS